MSEKLALNNSLTKGKRNTNIEILRIISMLLIVMFHAKRYTFPGEDSNMIVDLTRIVFGSWGILGVDLFLIISAWFLVGQKFRFSKVIDLFFTVFTWVFAYYVAYFLISYKETQSFLDALVNLIKYSVYDVFQPFWAYYYWFITTYFFMLLLSPLMNNIINNLSQGKFRKILLLLLFVPVYAQFSSSVVCDVFCFLYVYLFIGYIKRYGFKLIERFAKFRWIVLLAILVILSQILILKANDSTIFLRILLLCVKNTFATIGRHSIIMLIIALLIFFKVIGFKPTYNKFINSIGMSTIGVYLFHGNDSILELKQTTTVIFEKLLEGSFFSSDWMFPLKFIAVCIIITIVGILLEMIRRGLIHKRFMNYFLNRHKTSISKVDKWFNFESAAAE